MNTTSRFRLKIYALLAAMVILTMLISLSLSYFLSYDHQMKQLKIQMLQFEWWGIAQEVLPSNDGVTNNDPMLCK